MTQTKIVPGDSRVYHFSNVHEAILAVLPRNKTMYRESVFKTLVNLSNCRDDDSEEYGRLSRSYQDGFQTMTARDIQQKLFSIGYSYSLTTIRIALTPSKMSEKLCCFKHRWNGLTWKYYLVA